MTLTAAATSPAISEATTRAIVVAREGERM